MFDLLQLWVFYGDVYQRIPLEDKEGAVLKIGPAIEDDVTVLSYPFTNGKLTLTKSENKYLIHDGDKQIGELLHGKGITVEQKEKLMHLFVSSPPLSRKTYYIDFENEVTFSGTDDEATFKRSNSLYSMAEKGNFSLNKVTSGWIIKKDIPCTLYLNGYKCESNQLMRVGDVLQWSFMEIRLVEKDMLEVVSTGNYESALPEIEVPKSEVLQKYPEYRRTPRMIYELPEEKVSITFPAQESEDSNRGLITAIAAPLVMLIVMGTISIIWPRGIFIIISITMFIVVIINTTVQYVKDRKRRKEREEKRIRVYTAYLENLREEIHELSEKQKEVLAYHYPKFEQLKGLTEKLSGRIWERTIESHDFLEFRLGAGTIPSSFEIKLSSGDLANREIDNLLEQAQRIEKVYKEVPQAPVTTNLSEGILGLIGKENIIKREIQQIIGQLAFAHSYHDVRFIYIFKHEEYKEFEWMKWLPHFSVPNMHAKGFIHNEETRDQLLSSLYEMIRERDIEEEKEKITFSPHLVFIVSNYSLIAEHVILEFLERKNTQELGISVIFTETAKERITENVYTLVRYVNEREGDILIERGKAVNKSFQLDFYEPDTNERFARTLKTLNHQIGMKNSIPNSVGFLEMFEAKDIEEVPIDKFWRTNESAKSLAVPIGLKGKNELVHLNLHEKAHGPHGLLAGTTGSGKSEFLQTYILSLAVHFHPHEVAFLLIDYKGGGMAQPFRNIPHLLGTITNIEGSKNFSMRALASINSELKRRQRLFDQYSVSHINDYTMQYKSGLAKEPLPHLFLISDEFAELKSEEPDFIRELVSTARIGRSLGVHLILATQKPGGIIDDQIWSNARFRVALKVQDAADSKEILKNSDAASITVTGRGYLQVGNNEVYELFQSAWSGAPYMEETLEGEDDIAIVTDLGLLRLSGIETVQSKKKNNITEIEVVTAKIAEVQQKLSIKKLPSPWLPPLEMRIHPPEKWDSHEEEFMIAMIDEPEKQAQLPYSYQWKKDGSVGIFGSSGYGKSYTLLTLLLGLSHNLSPSEAHLYLMDYGNGSLLPLKKLPHTADYLTIDEELKRGKLMKLIREEISKRKVAFQQAEVSNIFMYNTISTEQLPLIYLVVDNYDIVREEMEELEAQLIQYGRDGQSLGIYLFITATRVQSVRQSLMNNLKTKIVHYLIDNSESYGVVGRVPFDLEPFAGRAIVKKEEAKFAQVYLPANGTDDFEVLEAIKSKVKRLKEVYKGVPTPSAIPMLPLDLHDESFKTYLADIDKKRLIPVGLDEETVQPISIDFHRNHHCLLIGQAQRGKTNNIKWMIENMKKQNTGFIAIFDSFDRGLSMYAGEDGIQYLETKDSLLEWLSEVEKQYIQLEQDFVENIQQGRNIELPLSYFIVDGYTRFLQVADAGIQDRLSKLMKKYSHLGFNVIVSGNNSELTKGFDPFTNELKLIRQGLLFMKKSEQTIFAVAYERKETELPLGFAHYILNGNATKILTPLCKIERKIMQ